MYRLAADVRKTKPEFVLLFCRREVSEPIRYLINASIPFMSEKPWGTSH